mgnify:CR=1 FL=1
MADTDSTKKNMSRQQQRDLDIEIGFLEGVVKRDRRNVEALQLLGDDYTQRGRYEEGLKIDRRLARLCPGDSLVQYNLACSFSLIAEHRKAPRGAATQAGEAAPLNSLPLKRLLDKLRVIPQTGKHTIVETKPWKEYTIGVLPGRRGGVVELTGEIYPTREDAEHAIFLKRLKALCEHYGIDMEV